MADSLLTYTAEAFVAASDSSHVRLQIDATPRPGRGKVTCAQLTVRLPEAIATMPPIPFVHSPRWQAGPAGGAPGKLTYVFDSITRGDEIDAKGFTFGFRIEKAELARLSGVTVDVEELAAVDGKPAETRTTTLPALSVRVVGPEILYFMSFRGNDPCTVFQRGEKPQLRWATRNVDVHELLIDGKWIALRGETSHVVETALERDTTMALRARRTVDGEVTYASLAVSVANPSFALPLTVRGPVPMGPGCSQIELGQPWGVTPSESFIGKPSGLPGDLRWEPGSAFIRFRDELADGPRKGTSIDFVTHNFGVGSHPALALAASGRVTIGETNTECPPEAHSVLAISRRYGAETEKNTIVSIDTSNTAKGFLWGNCNAKDWDGLSLSLNYYRFAGEPYIPNKGYGTGEIYFNRDGTLYFRTGDLKTPPTDRLVLSRNSWSHLAHMNGEAIRLLEKAADGAVWIGGTCTETPERTRALHLYWKQGRTIRMVALGEPSLSASVIVTEVKPD